MVSSIEYCRAQIDDLKERIREYERRHEDAAMILDGLKASLEVQQKLLASELDRRLKKEQDVAADTTCADTAARMRKCYEDASGKHYKPMGELDAWHHKHAEQPNRELAAQLPLMADAKPECGICDDTREVCLKDGGFEECPQCATVATVAGDKADVGDIVTAGKRDCEACHGGPCPRNEDCPNSPDVYREPWEQIVSDTALKSAKRIAERSGIEIGKYIGDFGGKMFFVAKTDLGNAIARLDSGRFGFEVLPGEEGSDTRDCRNWTEQRPDLEIAKHYRQAYDSALSDGYLPEHPRYERPGDASEFLCWALLSWEFEGGIAGNVSSRDFWWSNEGYVVSTDGEHTGQCNYPPSGIAYEHAWRIAAERGLATVAKPSQPETLGGEKPVFSQPQAGATFLGAFAGISGEFSEFWIGTALAAGNKPVIYRMTANGCEGWVVAADCDTPGDVHGFRYAYTRASYLGLIHDNGAKFWIPDNVNKGKVLPVPLNESGEKAWQPLPENPTDSRGVRYEGGRMVSKTGAVRSSDAQHERYDLIGTVGLRRLAETYAEGARKYTDDNWLKGFPVSDILNHTFRHFVLYRAGDRSEDHLAHAAFGLFAAMHYEENNPDCIDIKARLNPDGTVKQYRRWWENPE